jgi:hypothetical protein
LETSEFKEILQENNVKLDCDPIKRNLRLVEQGKPIQYKDLMDCLIKFKNQPNKIEKFEKKVGTIKPTNSHKQSESHVSHSKTNKKLITTLTPTFRSQKDFYDWEKVAYENALKNEENKDTITQTKPTSQIFNGEVNSTFFKSILRKDPNVKLEESDIMSWKSPKSSVLKVEVNLADSNYKKNTNVPNTTPQKSEKTKSICGYKNDSSLSIGRMHTKDTSVNLIRPMSTKNLKLHMSSNDNFLASLKTVSE